LKELTKTSSQGIAKTVAISQEIYKTGRKIISYRHVPEEMTTATTDSIYSKAIVVVVLIALVYDLRAIKAFDTKHVLTPFCGSPQKSIQLFLTAI
jgi:hypothetical protein